MQASNQRNHGTNQTSPTGQPNYSTEQSSNWFRRGALELLTAAAGLIFSGCNQNETMPVTKSAKIDQYGVTITGLFHGIKPTTLEVYAPANTTVEIIGYQPAGTISKEIMRIVISPRDDLKPTTLSILPEENPWDFRCKLEVQGENYTKSVGPFDLNFRPVGLPEN